MLTRRPTIRRWRVVPGAEGNRGGNWAGQVTDRLRGPRDSELLESQGWNESEQPSITRPISAGRMRKMPVPPTAKFSDSATPPTEFDHVVVATFVRFGPDTLKNSKNGPIRTR